MVDELHERVMTKALIDGISFIEQRIVTCRTDRDALEVRIVGLDGEIARLEESKWRYEQELRGMLPNCDAQALKEKCWPISSSSGQRSRARLRSSAAPDRRAAKARTARSRLA